MGTPVPNESEALLCPICWGPGKAFGPGTTPPVLTVTFADIDKKPGWHPGFGEPPDGPFVLTQVDGFPCFFRVIVSDNQFVIVLFSIGATLVVATSDEGFGAYTSTDGECETESENDGTLLFENGTAIITF